MDITEGFSDLAKKEKFTMDELDKIIESEEPEMPTPTQSSKKPETTSATVIENDSSTVVAEESEMGAIPTSSQATVTTAPDVMAEDEMLPTTKGSTIEGFHGSQYNMIREMKLSLIVLALTGLCFILNLEETDRYIASFIKNKCYVLIIRLAIFAVAAYVLLLIGNYLA